MRCLATTLCLLPLFMTGCGSNDPESWNAGRISSFLIEEHDFTKLELTEVSAGLFEGVAESPRGQYDVVAERGEHAIHWTTTHRVTPTGSRGTYAYDPETGDRSTSMMSTYIE